VADAADVADVAAYWPEIYALNRGLVGADPDLIRPGQLLRLADPSLTPTPGEDLP
jgi:nucleoid-associated protein YgaU